MNKIMNLVETHEKYRSSGINLVASENILSKRVLEVLSSDLNGRYAAELYGGTKYIREIISETENLLSKLFNTEYASSKPVSGTISVVASLLSLTEKEDKVAILHFKDGGFPLNISAFHRIPIYLIYDKEKYNIDAERSIDVLSKEKPRLVFLGASRILFPQPVKAISEFIHDYGGIVCYDGSHVLGLIASGVFQDPLREGADILVGSTHKTFPGPQGGVFLTNDKSLYKRFLSFLERPYTLVDNPHVARIAALGVATEEMIRYGEEYAKRTVSNAKAIAESLEKRQVNVLAKEHGYTESHQVLLEKGGSDVKNLLEEVNIFIDAIGRIGTQEVTRRGMGVSEMDKIAEWISETLSGGDKATIKSRVLEMAKKFNEVVFS